jgi:glycosyltransferase involved in cell wall biosynthesis
MKLKLVLHLFSKNMKKTNTNSKKLVVVQVLPSLISGGVEKGTLEVANYLSRNGHDSIVISNGGRLVVQLINDGSTHIKWPIGKKSILTFFYIIRLVILIKKKNIDIIHARSRLPAWIVFIALKFINKKIRPHFITTVHGFNSVGLYSSIMTKGDRVIVVSDSIRKFIHKNYNIDQSKVVLNYRGIEPKDYKRDCLLTKDWIKSWKKEFPVLDTKIILSIPSRITRRKGHEDFLELLFLLKNDKLNVHGLIIGDAKNKKNRYQSELEQKIIDYGLQEFVTFTGFRLDVKNIIAASNIVYSLSSEPESFGRTVIESIKLKTPVIGYDHGGVGEQLKVLFPEGLVSPKNMSELYKKTRIILKENPLIKETNLFQLKDMLKKTMNVYTNLTH